MGLSWAMSALVAVAWPRRSRGTNPAQVQSSPAPYLALVDNRQTDADFWGEFSPAPDEVAEPTQAPADPWTKIANFESGTDPGLYRTTVDNSARAYFEWRMSAGLTETGEERVIYQDYLDQCALGGYNPIPMVTWCRGMVKCGCTKIIRVRKYDSVNRERRPNILEWPTQLGMT